MSEDKFLENYKKKVIKECIKELCNNYKVFDKNDKMILSDDLSEILLSPKIIKKCIGFTKTSPIAQCSRNALVNCDYCKIHLNKQVIYEKQPEKLISCIVIPKEKSVSKLNLVKKFINDSFYFTSNTFIYNNDLQKIGYIDNKEYVFTSDPFILGLI